jgi:hypothetical protein
MHAAAESIAVGKAEAGTVRRVRRAPVADLFCGAGSLSMGANDALVDLGYRPEFIAVNHWDVATATYAKNHGGARVHCVNLDAAFPRSSCRRDGLTC